MTSNTPTPPTQTDGSRIYSSLILYFYDWWVCWASNTNAWECPTLENLLPLFRSTLGRRHLDVGVGSGYFPAKTLNGSPCEEMTLLDLNPMALLTSQRRIESAVGNSVKVDTVIADAAAPLSLPETRKFDSISLFYLLHCMAGPLDRKTALFTAMRKQLAPEGVLVGATILGREIERNWFAEKLMNLYNRKGVFDNWDDTREGFEEGLKREFEEVDTWIVGRVMMFKARRPKAN